MQRWRIALKEYAIILILSTLFSNLKILLILEFIQEPTSVNISAGSVAVFKCVATSPGQFWTVDGFDSIHVNHDPRNITKETVDAPVGSPRTHILRVPTIDINNNTEFGCTLYSASKVISSQYCYLKIQNNNETKIVLDKIIVCIAGLHHHTCSI